MAQFSPEVERWRSTVAKYFPSELVDKALWTIQHESGGNPGAVGDGGVARGLFQIQDKTNFSNRPDAAYLDDPENNIKYAAEQLGAASGNFGAWGEGTTNQGKPFGAFGNNSYPGDGGGSSMPDGPGYQKWLSDYAPLQFAWTPLHDKIAPYLVDDGNGGRQLPPDGKYDSTLGYYVLVPTKGGLPGSPQEYTQQVVMDPAEWAQYTNLSEQLGTLDSQFQTQFPAFSLDDAIKRATFSYNTDPRNIDAENAAKAYAREMDVRQQATSLANQQLSEQRPSQQAAMDSLNNRQRGQALMSPSTNLASADQLFERAVATVKKGLPDVPNAPYYSGGLPGAGGMPSLGDARAQAAAQATAQAATQTAALHAGSSGPWSSFGTGAPNPLVDSVSTGSASPITAMATAPAPIKPMNTTPPRPLSTLNPVSLPAIPQSPFSSNSTRTRPTMRGSLFYSRI